ncbi:MAG: carbon-nitrogen hydrolase family protein [Kiritimatiellae bacterium]|nr:carbon-nitrogen hydrolase family protein [Kiritimatiellia bacterium]MDD5521164.1 carbon-nitrogen hydrolase family protein [Kiritimatiellia bacterium]
MKITVYVLVIAFMSNFVVPVNGQEVQKPQKLVRVGAVALSWADGDRNLKHVLELLEQAVEQHADIVCLPQECVITDGGEKAKEALSAIAKIAASNKMYIVANLREKEADKLFLTSYLIGSDGNTIGKYRKTHRMPDESIALGDQLPVFDTAFGKVGLMIGSDHFWPEIPLVLALQGAELILCSNYPEAVPQSAPMDVKMRVRAMDNHVTMVSADYVGNLPYFCSNHPGYTGEPLGRSCIIDRSGIVLADTGFKEGVVVAQVDLHRTKHIYNLTFHEDRKLFHYLSDPNIKSQMPNATKRKIRVNIAQVFGNHGPNPDPNSVFAKIIDDAGNRGGDVIVMSEFGMRTDDEKGKKTLALVAEKALKYKTYIIIGGLHDPNIPDKNGRATSWAYLWDRAGKVVGKYRISQYGLSKELPVFQTDFGVVGIILCGDIYSMEISRALAIQGAEIIFCPSQSWAPSGTFNLWMQQVRAIDNGVYMAAVHFPFSDSGQRSYVIDPYGHVLAATPFWSEGVVTADVDLDAGQIWFARTDKPGRAGQKGYMSGYYPKTIPDKRTDLRSVLLAGRRPELYRIIPEKSLADRDFPDELKDRMGFPR